jgi:hypothetical protein
MALLAARAAEPCRKKRRSIVHLLKEVWSFVKGNVKRGVGFKVSSGTSSNSVIEETTRV